MINILELRERLQPHIAEPSSDEGQAVINNDSTHVSEVWEDGEITTTKSGDLYRHRNIHQSEKPFIPVGQVLFDVDEYRELANRETHKRMVITDDVARSILAQYRDVHIDKELIDDLRDCSECGDGVLFKETQYKWHCDNCDHKQKSL